MFRICAAGFSARGRRIGVAERPGQLAVEEVDVDECIGRTEDVAELVLRRPKLRCSVQFVSGPRRHECFGELA
jgi:hypothetical protein